VFVGLMIFVAPKFWANLLDGCILRLQNGGGSTKKAVCGMHKRPTVPHPITKNFLVFARLLELLNE
jgi:hypothetical protein